ncbi:MAG: MBL fold metallo-hydrolase [Lachnospiraceae bacterium]|nr:MBL fold metallo-hydrolase [Candidatus Equihabitans merdae]
MQVTYLGHSGFMLETDYAYYVFDYYRGAVPTFNAEGTDKPVFVFSSHRHEDHYVEKIITDQAFAQTTTYFLSHDIARRIRRLQKDEPDQQVLDQLEKIVYCREGDPIEQDGLRISCLKSTDIGVAFVVEELASGLKFYHAGDLNWWHWEEEGKAYNRNMEVNFKREIDRIAGSHFDAAFMLLDPRLEGAYCYGMNYFLEKCSADMVFPMHMWEHYEYIQKYLDEHPENGLILTRDMPKDAKAQGKSYIAAIEKDGQLFC